MIAQGAANSLWAIATLKVTDQNVIMKLAQACYNLAGDMNAQEAANSLWAIATLKVTDKNVIMKLAQACCNLVGKMSAQNAANSMWAIARLGVTDRDVISVLGRAFVETRADNSHLSGGDALLLPLLWPDSQVDLATRLAVRFHRSHVLAPCASAMYLLTSASLRGSSNPPPAGASDVLRKLRGELASLQDTLVRNSFLSTLSRIAGLELIDLQQQPSPLLATFRYEGKVCILLSSKHSPSLVDVSFVQSAAGQLSDQNGCVSFHIVAISEHLLLGGAAGVETHLRLYLGLQVGAPTTALWQPLALSLSSRQPHLNFRLVRASRAISAYAVLGPGRVLVISGDRALVISFSSLDVLIADAEPSDIPHTGGTNNPLDLLTLIIMEQRIASFLASKSPTSSTATCDDVAGSEEGGGRLGRRGGATLSSSSSRTSAWAEAREQDSAAGAADSARNLPVILQRLRAKYADAAPNDGPVDANPAAVAPAAAARANPAAAAPAAAARAPPAIAAAGAAHPATAHAAAPAAADACASQAHLAAAPATAAAGAAHPATALAAAPAAADARAHQVLLAAGDAFAAASAAHAAAASALAAAVNSVAPTTANFSLPGTVFTVRSTSHDPTWQANFKASLGNPPLAGGAPPCLIITDSRQR
jgi:hypothetical protein